MQDLDSECMVCSFYILKTTKKIWHSFHTIALSKGVIFAKNADFLQKNADISKITISWCYKVFSLKNTICLLSFFVFVDLLILCWVILRECACQIFLRVLSNSFKRLCLCPLHRQPSQILFDNFFSFLKDYFLTAVYLICIFASDLK